MVSAGSKPPPPPSPPGVSTVLIQEYEEDPTPSQMDVHAAAPSARSFVVTVVPQQNGSSDPTNRNQNRLVVEESNTTRRIVTSLWRSPASWLHQTFLPVGYPHSVAAGYRSYQAYDSLQGLCSYLRGVLCQASVLQAAGVGNAEAVALSAALTWALKDGMALTGGLVFSSWASPHMDAHLKEFRLYADFINNVGLFLDLLAPYFVPQFLWITAAAGLCKTMCGIAAGATKGSLTQHFAITGNLADVAAKEQAQETLVSLVGMLLGMALARFLQILQEEEAAAAATAGSTAVEFDLTVEHVTWGVFATLTIIHMWANTKAVQGLRLRTLNAARAQVAFQTLTSTTLFDMLMSSFFVQANSLLPAMRTLPRPDDVAEALFAPPHPRLRLGVSLSVLLEAAGGGDLQILYDFAQERYVLAVDRQRRVHVTLLQKCTPRDEVQAFCHALLTLAFVDRFAKQQNRPGNANPQEEDGDAETRRTYVCQTLQQTKRLFSSAQHNSDAAATPVSVWSQLHDKGWNLDRVYLGFGPKRSQWAANKTE